MVILLLLGGSPKARNMQILEFGFLGCRNLDSDCLLDEEKCPFIRIFRCWMAEEVIQHWHRSKKNNNLSTAKQSSNVLQGSRLTFHLGIPKGRGGYVDWNSEDMGGSLDWNSEGMGGFSGQ